MDDPNPCTANLASGGGRQFSVTLQQPQNARLGHSQVDVRVWDLQRLPVVTLLSPRGVPESAGLAVFTVGLTRVSDDDVTVVVQTRQAAVNASEPFTAHASAPADFVAISGRVVTVPAGTLSVPIAVTIVDDSSAEPAEGFALALTSATNATLGNNSSAEAWIIDDDTQPEVSVGDISVAEDSATAAFTVVLDRAYASDVTVDYATADGTATAPGDYTATSGPLRIAAGNLTAAVQVTLVDDDTDETDETFTLQLSGAVGAGIVDGTATATIRDDDRDDDLPVVSIADLSMREQDLSGEFAVTLSAASS